MRIQAIAYAKVLGYEPTRRDPQTALVILQDLNEDRPTPYVFEIPTEWMPQTDQTVKITLEWVRE